MSGAPDFDLEFKEATSTTADSDPNTVKVTQTATEPEIPDKYKGKTFTDVINMHLNAEKKISEQGQQLGELRSHVDQILGLKQDNVKPKDKPKVTAEDLFTDPNTALEKIITSSEIADKVDKTAERMTAIERSIGQSDFESRYPNFVEDVNNPDFRAWVGANKARAGLLLELNNNYNFEAGIALWDMWKERQELAKSSAKQEDNVNVRETIKAASTVRNSPAGEVKKPIYSRAKLLELQTKALQGDPAAKARWNDAEFQREYHLAYAEGRVK